MMMRISIRKLFARPVIRPLRKAPFRAHPALEALEHRTVPSFTVTNTLDDGSEGSLRWAIGQANVTGGDETIDFDPTVFGTPRTIALGGTQLELTDTTGTETITGPAAGVTVDGGGLSRVFQVDGGVTASVSGLTISRGYTTGNGGGLLNLGTTMLSNCTISGNHANGRYSSGGGITNIGTLSLTHCTVSGNSALYSGGITNTGTLTLTDCTVSGNSAVGRSGGGGGLTSGGVLTMTHSTISGNSAGYYGSGGGLLLGGGGTSTLTDCTVSGNSANYGGGVYAIAGPTTLTLTDCTVSGNRATFGGGVDNDGATLTLTNCTVSGNSATFRGAVSNLGGRITLTNCTVSGNSVTGYQTAGGITNYTFANLNATVLLLNSIIANNTVGSGDRTGSQLYSGRWLGIGMGQATVQFSNTIFTSDGLRPNLFADTGGTFLSQGYNLSSDDGSGFLTGAGDITNVDPRLGPLQYNGGPTQTMALLAASPALNAGDPAQLGVPDQRGVIRTGGVNIGAFQASATAFVIRAPGMVQSGVPFDVTVTALDAFGQLAVGYTGTVTFSSTDQDPGVVLPADYTFSLSDAGSVTFATSATLISSGLQMIVATDTANNTITGNATVMVGGTAPGPGSHGQEQERHHSSLLLTNELSDRKVVALERFASFYDPDYVWLAVPRLNHQARGDTTLGMALLPFGNPSDRWDYKCPE